jgi:protein ImuB
MKFWSKNKRIACLWFPDLAETDRTALEELAMQCESYSPCVGLEEAESPRSLVLDITGIAHLFGGEFLLVRRLQKELAAKHWTARMAVSDSVGAAWAAAHYLADAKTPVVIPVGQFNVLFDLPIEGLRLGESVVQKLHRLGIRTIRQLRGLKRSSLPARFGGEINDRLDQFTGERAEPIAACRPPQKFRVKQFSEYGTTQPEIIEQWCGMLLERLVGLLQEKRMGTRHLQGAFITERKIQHGVTIRLCQPSADARHLGDLLRLHMERLRFESPVVGIRMEALDTSRLEQPQQAFFGGPSQNLVRQLSSLLNRMSSRLGHQAVVHPRLLPEAVPERAFEYVPVTETVLPTAKKMDRALQPFDRPACLFPQPKSVEVVAVAPNGPPSVFFIENARFDILQSWGPERIESGWWQGPCVRRDYFQVETTEGRRFWLFRRLQDGRWFLHGGMF